MSFTIVYRERFDEDSESVISITYQHITYVNRNNRNSRVRLVDVDELRDLSLEHESSLKNCTISINKSVDLNEELFNFIVSKFRDFIEKFKPKLQFVFTDCDNEMDPRLCSAYDFGEKLKTSGIKFSYYVIILYTGGIIFE